MLTQLTLAEQGKAKEFADKPKNAHVTKGMMLHHYISREYRYSICF
jgi:hypothetical protein